MYKDGVSHSVAVREVRRIEPSAIFLLALRTVCNWYRVQLAVSGHGIKYSCRTYQSMLQNCVVCGEPCPGQATVSLPASVRSRLTVLTMYGSLVEVERSIV
jgi:hypothetical protein